MKNQIFNPDIFSPEVKLKIKNIFLLFFLVFTSCIIINSCSNINEPEEWDKENLVAFSAIYYSNPSTGYTGRIVIADYHNPKKYKIITPEELKAVGPVFSYNKEKILFGLDGRLAGEEHFAVYDVETGKMEELYAKNISEAPVGGSIPIWDLNNNGFYFTQQHTYSIAMGIYYYDLTTREVTGLYNPQDASVYVIGLKSPDTLIVFSNKYFLASNDSNCFFYMSKSGEYLAQIKNQHLELININGVTRKGPLYTYWNYKNKQFSFSAINVDQTGYAISITDIEGTFRNQYTNSHYDTRPVWGPGNSIIFFNRTDDNQLEQLYYVDTVTGNVQQYIDPAAINGAVQIIDAAY